MSKNTLIIDDDKMSRGLLRMVLEYDGCLCVEADDGAQGLSLLETEPFDVVILDYRMPVMDGIEFLTRVRHLAQKRSVPVIMLTAYLSEEIQAQATRLGAYAIIGKPYDLGELRSMVTQLCESSAPVPYRSPMPSFVAKTDQSRHQYPT